MRESRHITPSSFENYHDPVRGWNTKGGRKSMRPITGVNTPTDGARQSTVIKPCMLLGAG